MKGERNAMAKATSLGIQMAIIMGLSFFGGFKADKHFGTMPLFTLLCSAIGFAAAMYFVIKSVKK